MKRFWFLCLILYNGHLYYGLPTGHITSSATESTVKSHVSDPVELLNETLYKLELLSNDFKGLKNEISKAIVELQGSAKSKKQMLLIIGSRWWTTSTNDHALRDSISIANGAWTLRAPYPTKVDSPAATQGPDGKVVAIGGDYEGRATNLCYIYDSASDKWTTGPSMNTRRIRHNAVTLGSKVYAIGGWNNNYTNLDSVEVLDWTKGASKWEYVAPMLSDRYGAGAVVYNGNIYVIGGFRKKSGEKYITEEDKWISIPDMLQNRQFHGLVVLKNKIYACGGYDRETESVWRSCESFDGDIWEEEAPMNQPRYDAVTGVIGDKIYVVGGQSRFESWDPVMSVETYDSSTEKWTLINITGSSQLPLCYMGSTVVDLP